MKTSRAAKGILTYLPLVVGMAVIAVGVFLAREQRQTPVVVQAQTAAPSYMQPTTSLSTERSSPLLQGQATPPSMILPSADTCTSGAIYTTLPPKCMNAEGKLILVPGSAFRFFSVTPGK